ncbi:unnamed protein product [Ambrosiozyma monospora]|uniref:Unnamed protein product n=1 Tax=Ambrosiozyma monospora TaxID=43982 RepID=A0A9W6T3Z5_AMBMO|nr:unnamed protein product [Ambrosiozyma monospora]
MMDKVSMLPKITSYYVDVYAHSYGCPPIVPGYTAGGNFAMMTATKTIGNGAATATAGGAGAGGSKPTGFDYQGYGNRFQKQNPN